jgi:hypothetical protein
MKNKKLIYECRTHKLLTEQWNLLTEDQRNDIKLFEREIAPLYHKLHEALSANLTEPDVEKLFKRAEKISSGERTGIGKAIDAAKLPVKIASQINKKMDDLFKEKIKTMQPVKNFDAAFDKVKESLVKNTGGEKGLGMEIVESYRNLCKKHPVIQSLVIAALTTLAGIAFGPLGGAIANFGFRSIDRLLKGEDISDVLYKGIKSAVVGALVGLGARKLTEMIGNAYVEWSNPVKFTKDVNLVQGSISVSTNDPSILKALKDAGLESSGNDSSAFSFYTTDEAAATAFKTKMDALNKFISQNDPTDPESLKYIVGQAKELSSTADAISTSMDKIFEQGASKSYLLDPSKNAVLQQMGINNKVSSFDEYENIFKQFKEKFNVVSAGGSAARPGEIGYISNQIYKQAGLSVEQAANVGELNFIPTEEFAKTMADVVKQVDVSRVSMEAGIDLVTKGSNLASVESFASVIKSTRENAVDAANAIINSGRLSKFFAGLGEALQAASQGAVAGADTARDNKKDANPGSKLDDLKESMLLKDILINEGIFDKAKSAFKTAKDAVSGAVSSAGEKIGTAATNLTQKVTYDKLITAWKKAGKPLELSKVLDIMKKVGMKDADIEAAQKDEDPSSDQPQDRTEKIKRAAEFIKKNKLEASVISYIKSTGSSKGASASPSEK